MSFRFASDCCRSESPTWRCDDGIIITDYSVACVESDWFPSARLGRLRHGCRIGLPIHGGFDTDETLFCQMVPQLGRVLPLHLCRRHAHFYISPPGHPS